MSQPALTLPGVPPPNAINHKSLPQIEEMKRLVERQTKRIFALEEQLESGEPSVSDDECLWDGSRLECRSRVIYNPPFPHPPCQGRSAANGEIEQHRAKIAQLVSRTVDCIPF